MGMGVARYKGTIPFVSSQVPTRNSFILAAPQTSLVQSIPSSDRLRYLALGLSAAIPVVILLNRNMCLDFIRSWLNPYWMAEKHLEKADKCYATFTESREKGYLEDALREYEEAKTCSGREHEKYPNILIQYVRALQAHPNSEGNDIRRDDVLQYLREVQEIWERKEPKPKGYPTVLNNLATAHMGAYRRKPPPSGDADLRKASALYRKVLDLPIGPQRREALIGAGNAFWTECEHDRSIALSDAIQKLKMAIGYLNEADSLSNDDDPEIQALILRNRASSNDVLYRRLTGEPTTKMDYLDNAISDNVAALTKLEETDPDAATIRCNLAKQYLRRYIDQQPRRPKDLVDAQSELNTVKEMLQNSEIHNRQVEEQIATIEAELNSHRDSSLRQDTNFSTGSGGQEFYDNSTHPYTTDPLPM